MSLTGTVHLQMMTIPLEHGFSPVFLHLPQITDVHTARTVGYNTDSALSCQQVTQDSPVIYHHLA